MHYTWITATDLKTYKRRYRILDDLEDRPRTVSELADLHGVSRNTVRRHIQELRREGVIVRYNPSDKRYYSARHILREEERRRREMIPRTILPSQTVRVEETKHPVEIGVEDCTPTIGVTRWFSDKSTIWIVRMLKNTMYGGEECFETRRDVYNSAMKHICYSYWYEQITPGGRYLLGDVQTNASVPSTPIVCYHKPKELVYPLPLIEGQSWKEIHTEQQPYFSLREGKETKVKTVSETRGSYRVRVGRSTRYCLRVLRARENSLSELFLDEGGVEVLLRNYISEDSSGWTKDLKTQPSIRLGGMNYHRRGEGLALCEPLNTLL